MLPSSGSFYNSQGSFPSNSQEGQLAMAVFSSLVLCVRLRLESILERFSTRVGSGLVFTWLERPVDEKHCSLIVPFVSSKEKTIVKMNPEFYRLQSSLQELDVPLNREY